MSGAGLVARAAEFDGRLVWWQDGDEWKVGAERWSLGVPSGEGGVYAWLDREPVGTELYRVLRRFGGDLDRASELWVERYGGRFGYFPAMFPAVVLVVSCE